MNVEGDWQGKVNVNVREKGSVREKDDRVG